MRALAALYLAAVSIPVAAGNYAACILERMPGTLSPPAAYAVSQECRRSHPEMYSDIKPGEGISLIPFVGYANPDHCVVSKTKKTSDLTAVKFIVVACRCLYDNSGTQAASCAMRDFLPARRVN